MDARAEDSESRSGQYGIAVSVERGIRSGAGVGGLYFSQQAISVSERHIREEHPRCGTLRMPGFGPETPPAVSF